MDKSSKQAAVRLPSLVAEVVESGNCIKSLLLA